MLSVISQPSAGFFVSVYKLGADGVAGVAVFRNTDFWGVNKRDFWGVNNSAVHS